MCESTTYTGAQTTSFNPLSTTFLIEIGKKVSCSSATIVLESKYKFNSCTAYCMCVNVHVVNLHVVMDVQYLHPLPLYCLERRT